MAISVTAAAINSLYSDRIMALASSSSSQMPSSLSSLQFPISFGVFGSEIEVSILARSLEFVLWVIPVILQDYDHFELIGPRAMEKFKVEAKKQTFSTFDELLTSSEKPVLVDFYATWCGPCQMMVPVLNEVSAALEDKVLVVKIDTEKYPSIANKYRIEALPTFIIFKNGKPCDRFEGALTANQLIQRAESTLKVKQ